LLRGELEKERARAGRTQRGKALQQVGILVCCRPGEEKKRDNTEIHDLYTQMRRSTALRMFLSYVTVQAREE